MISQRALVALLWAECDGDRDRVSDLFARGSYEGFTNIKSVASKANPKRLAQLLMGNGLSEGWLPSKSPRDGIPAVVLHWVLDRNVEYYRRVLMGLVARLDLTDMPEHKARASNADARRLIAELEVHGHSLIDRYTREAEEAEAREIARLGGDKRRTKIEGAVP